jgi:hypothetical protein
VGQAVIVIAIVAVAVIVGQAYPLLGALIATFPTKIFAYALASDPTNGTEAFRGLMIGSLASAACTAAMWYSLAYGLPAALGAGLAAWSAIVLIGKLVS